LINKQLNFVSDMTDSKPHMPLAAATVEPTKKPTVLGKRPKSAIKDD
jgi:hypothetical protein